MDWGEHINEVAQACVRHIVIGNLSSNIAAGDFGPAFIEIHAQETPALLTDC